MAEAAASRTWRSRSWKPRRSGKRELRVRPKLNRIHHMDTNYWIVVFQQFQEHWNGARRSQLGEYLDHLVATIGAGEVFQCGQARCDGGFANFYERAICE